MAALDHPLPDATKASPSRNSKQVFRWAWFGILLVLVVAAVALRTTIIPESQANQYAQQGWATYPQSSRGSDNSSLVRQVDIDPQGRPWVTTADGIAMLGGDGKWVSYPNAELKSAAHKVLVIDRQGRAWVGSDRYQDLNSGLRMLNTNGQWTTYTHTNSGLAYDTVHALAVDAQDRVWVGADGGLRMLGPDGQWTTYTRDNSGLPANDVYGLAADQQGRVWVGGVNYLSMVDPAGHWTSYLLGGGGYANTIVVDSQRRVWVATVDGLQTLNPDGTWTMHHDISQALMGSSFALAANPQGRVWVGADRGVAVVEADGTWTTYTADNSPLDFGDIGVRSLAIDPTGRAWFATRAGLTAFDPTAANQGTAGESATPQAPAAPLSSLHMAILVLLIPMALATAIWALARYRLAGLSVVSALLSPVIAPSSEAGDVFVLLYMFGGLNGIPNLPGNAQVIIYLYLIGSLLPIVAIVAGIIALLRTRSTGRRVGRIIAVAGLVLAALELVNCVMPAPLTPIFQLIPHL